MAEPGVEQKKKRIKRNTILQPGYAPETWGCTKGQLLPSDWRLWVGLALFHLLAPEAIQVEDNLNLCLPDNFSHPRHDIFSAGLSERKSTVHGIAEGLLVMGIAHEPTSPSLSA